MEKFKDIRVRYTHPSIPPVGIKLGSVYSVEDLIETYKLDSLQVKTIFTPTNCNWDDLEDKKVKRNKKEVKLDDLDIRVEI